MAKLLDLKKESFKNQKHSLTGHTNFKKIELYKKLSISAIFDRAIGIKFLLQNNEFYQKSKFFTVNVKPSYVIFCFDPVNSTQSNTSALRIEITCFIDS